MTGTGGYTLANGAAVPTTKFTVIWATTSAPRKTPGSEEFLAPALSRQLCLAIISIFLALALIQGFPTDNAMAWVTRSTT